MATNTWVGNAGAVAQTVNLTPAAVQIGDTFSAKINGKSVTYTAIAATIADVVNGLQALLAASTIPEFKEVVWSVGTGTAYIVGTAAVPGVPFTATLARTQSAALAAPTGLTAVPAVANGSLVSGTTYYYKVTAITVLGETTASAEASVAATATGAITVGWSASSGATGYKVYRGTAAAGEVYLVTVGAVTSYLDFGTPPVGTATPPTSNTAAVAVPSLTSVTGDVIAGNVGAGTYFYKISAITVLGESTVSNEHSDTIAGTGEFVLVWGAVTGATGYKVYRGTTTNVENKLVTTTGAVTTYTDTTAAPPTGIPPTNNGAYIPIPVSPTAVVAAGGNGSLTNATEYFWKVTATNAAGETTGSTEVSCYATSTGGVVLSWTAVTNATGYNVYRSTAAAGENLVQKLGTAVTFTDYGTIATIATAVPGGNTTASASTFSLTTPTASAGPNDVSVAANWSAAAIPANGDDVWIVNSSVSLLYGLTALNGVTATTVNVDPTFTGTAGLPANNPLGYEEYRQQYLQISPTTFNVFPGQGQGSTLLKFDFGSVAVTANVAAVGFSSVQGQPSVILLGTNAGNVLNVNQGQVGSAIYPGEVATWATINVGYIQSVLTDVTLWLGKGCTLTTISQGGGTVNAYASATTWTVNAGLAIPLQTMTIATLKVQGGACYQQSSGTVTTGTVYVGGVLDLSRDQRSKTFTTLTIQGGGTLNDPFKVGIYTNPVSFPNGIGGNNGAKLNWGLNINLART